MIDNTLPHGNKLGTLFGYSNYANNPKSPKCGKQPPGVVASKMLAPRLEIIHAMPLGKTKYMLANLLNCNTKEARVV
mgnify:CR=1 FL=1